MAYLQDIVTEAILEGPVTVFQVFETSQEPSYCDRDSFCVSVAYELTAGTDFHVIHSLEFHSKVLAGAGWGQIYAHR